MISNVVNDYGYDNERSQSITGIAEGMSSTGQTFGVVGSYDGYGGAGVYGSFGISTPVSDGRFAGYFSGNVKVTGTLVATVVSNSDLRLKEEVRELNEDDEGTLDKLNLLSPISYKYNADLLEPNTVNILQTILYVSMKILMDITHGELVPSHHHVLLMLQMNKIQTILIHLLDPLINMVLLKV